MPKAGCTSGPRSSNRLRVIHSIFLAVAPLVCLDVPSVAQAANRVTAVRSWSAGDTTRVAVEVSGEPSQKAFGHDAESFGTEPDGVAGLRSALPGRGGPSASTRKPPATTDPPTRAA